MIKWVLGAAASVVALASSPASAQIAAGSVPAASSVALAYDAHRIQPIWFRNGSVDDAAVNQLVAILQRAPFDGFAEGPQLAAGRGLNSADSGAQAKAPCESCVDRRVRATVKNGE